MHLQDALKSKRHGKYTFSRVFPFLVFSVNFSFFTTVVVAMAFSKTNWDKWSGPLMFSVLTLGPSLFPLLVQTYAEHKNVEPKEPSED